MQVLHTFAELPTLGRPIDLAIGVFDGVHLGHQRVIGQSHADAQATGGASVVLTFDPHPLRVINPDKAPPLLTSTPHKLALIRQLGVDACLVLKFDKEFPGTSPETFLKQIAAPAHRLQEICVGDRFHFGHDRTGNVRLMEQLAPGLGFTVKEIQSVHTGDGEMISSSAVRQHVRHGQLDRAAAMLGRPFSMLGTVEPGDQRGRSLGFPTANLNPHNEVLPPDGVYAAHVQIGAERLPSIVNVGLRPTFKQSEAHRLVEVHVLDFNRDLYGQDIEVAFIQKLRGELKFPSAEALTGQIRADIETARRILASHD